MNAKALTIAKRIPAFRIAAACLAVLIGILLIGDRIRLSRTEYIDTSGWGVCDLLEHLKQRGVELRAIPAVLNGDLEHGAYLTENPNENWHDMVKKTRLVAHISEWKNTILVIRTLPAQFEDPDVMLPHWGAYGCRIGDFVLFGDEFVLSRVQKACRR